MATAAYDETSVGTRLVRGVLLETAFEPAAHCRTAVRVPMVDPSMPKIFAAAVFLTCFVDTATASASASRITEVDIVDTQALGKFGGVPYVRTYGTLHGEAGPGEQVSGLASLAKDGDGNYRYASQFEMIAPDRGSTANTVVFVEAENRGEPIALDALNGISVRGGPMTATYEPGLGNGFLQRHATSYARVQWQAGIASAVPQTAQGVGLVIMRDFARFLTDRMPTARVEGGPRPTAYSRSLLGGISQSSWFANTFVAEGFNVDPGDGSRVFDGALAIDGTGNWLAINQIAARNGVQQHPYLEPNGVPLSTGELAHRPGSDPIFVDVANYTDFYRLRASLTDLPPASHRFRRYDWPSPHAPVRGKTAAAAVFKAGCNSGHAIPLNPIGYRPFLHAVVLGLEKAIGVPAASSAPSLPPSTVFALGPAPAGSEYFNPLPGVALQVPLVDADGMPKGGVRFPDAKQPLGRAVPAALPPVVTTSIAALCGNLGGFQPFTAAELAARYGGEKSYLALYRASVRKLIAEGFVLPEGESPMLQDALWLYRNR
jgi:hypothetical protein